MTLNTFRPTLSELGDRIVPSAVLNKPASLAPALTAPAPSAVPSHPLNGTGTGAYHVAQTPVAGLGERRDFFGKMTFKGLGTFDVTGSVRAVASAGGRATGTLYLTDAKGTITLNLRGPIQSANGAMPSEFVYNITKATGAYESLHGGYGLIQVSFAPPVRQPAGAVVGGFQMWVS